MRCITICAGAYSPVFCSILLKSVELVKHYAEILIFQVVSYRQVVVINA